MNTISWFFRGFIAALITVGIVLIKTPIWFWDIATRPRPTKEYPNGLQIYFTYLARTFLRQCAIYKAQPNPSTRQPSKLRDRLLCRRFTWIEPAPLSSAEHEEKRTTAATGFDDSSLPVALDKAESKKKTAALWYLNSKEPGDIPTKEQRRQSRVVLYFHGGAYIALEAGDMFMGLTLARMQAKYVEVDVLSVNYRLAPGSKYPSQLYEAFSAWRHLRQMGYESIFLGGDSAGGNLALTLWRYLDQVANDSQAVEGIILHSPWVDWNGLTRASFNERTPHCAVTYTFGIEGVKSMQTNGLPKVTDGWASPIYWTDNILSRLPPMFVNTAGIEALREENEMFVGAAKSAGAKVTHIITEGMPHDFTAQWWFAGAVRRLFLQAHTWIDGVKMAGEA